jgi:hypothetical protein
MGKTFLGFVVGVALTSLAFVLLGSAPESTESPSVVAEEARSDAVLTPQVDNSQSDDSVLSAAAEPQVEEKVSVARDFLGTIPSAEDLLASVSDELSGEVDTSRLQEQLLEAYLRAGTELADTLLAARPVLLPSPLPHEFAWVSERPNADFFHESFQREDRDEPWASAAESELLRHISGQFELTQKYGYPTVECHTTRCIVKFLGYGVDEDPGVATRDLGAATREYQESSELVGCVTKPLELCVSAAHSEGGVTTIYWGIRKNEE